MTLERNEQILLALRKLQKELKAYAEAIAIVGFSYRLPGGDLWTTLSGGHDRTQPTTFRWPHLSLPISRGSFVNESVEFADPAFFEIAALEAETMDPQHRFLLECAQEAFDLAGLTPAKSTGAFLSLMATDHLERIPTLSLSEQQFGYFGANNNHYGAANRISYAFDLHGPSQAIDGACSGSLVTVHEGCLSLRNRECDMAVVGGVNLMLSAGGMLGIAALHAGSPDGRCKTFDASADGYGRGEGCGILILKRLSDAQRDGDRIFGQLLGSAVNHGGRTAGYSVPSSQAQADLLSLAMARANVTPEDVQYLEAHGTGTKLGDPIEIEGIATAHAGRTTPLSVGSVKTNFGHLEAAAGISGLLKVVLSIRHRQLPPNLHLVNPNPYIPWESVPVRIQTELSPWPTPSKPLVAGISSFGFGGTNAHVIISEAPVEPATKWEAADLEASREGLLLPLGISAKTPKALREYAERFLAMLESPADETYFTTWRDIAHTSTVRRQHMEERLVVVGSSKVEWATKLRAYLQGGEGVPGIAKGNGKESKNRVVFVFPGQGAQWLGMGKSLLQKNAAFRLEIARIEKAFSKHVDWTLTEEIEKADAVRFNRLDIIQPLLFAMAAGIAASLRTLGIEPSAVVGHSQGEVAAAYVAGGLSLEDAALIICLRSRLVEKTRGSGHMMVVGLSMAEAEAELVRFDGTISVAASNGPSTTILSGDAKAAETLATELEARGVFVRLLKVGYASHSHQMDPLQKELVDGLSALAPMVPKTRFASTALPGADEPRLDASYWWQNLRNPVRFHERIRSLVEDDGYNLFLEISPHPGLTSSIQDTLSALKGHEGLALSSLRKNEDEHVGLLETFASLHAHGYSVDWKTSFTNESGDYVWGRVAELPNYPWQRQKYWLSEKKEKKASYDSKWPFIHSHTESASHPGEHIFQVELDLSEDKFAYLEDHKVQGNIWFPGTGFIEMALEVGTELLGNKFSGVTDLVFKEAMVLSKSEPTILQLVVSTPRENGAYPFSVSSRLKSDGSPSWTLHASGFIASERLVPGDMPRLQEVRNRLNQSENPTKSSQELYSDFEDIDLSYGPAFRGLLSLATNEGEALGSLFTPTSVSDVKAYLAHPALLDAAFQASVGALSALKLTQTFVPASAGHIRTLDSSASAAFALTTIRSSDPKNLSIDVYLLDKNGRLLTEVIALGLKPIGQVQDKLDKWMWNVHWRSVSAGNQENDQGPWLLIEDSKGIASELKTLLEKKNQKVTLVRGNFSEPEFYFRFLEENFPKSPPKKVVHLTSLDVPEGLSHEACKQGENIACLTALFLVQAIQKLQPSWDLNPKLFFVTRGAQPPVTAPAQAMLWGLGACLPHEMPELETTLIDLHPDTSAQALLNELTHSDSENRIALRKTDNLAPLRNVQRLERLPRTGVHSAPTFEDDKTFLITGGFGGIAQVIISTLANLGVKHFALVGRSGASEATQKVLDTLARERGLSFYPIKADISDREQVRVLASELKRQGAPDVTALVHAAVVLKDATVENQTPATFRQAIAPKVDGLLSLLNVFAFDRVIHFSSAAGLVGNGGQTNYAAANALLDASAHHLKDNNVLAMSLDWGAWSDTGAATSKVITDNLLRQGIGTITSPEGAILFERSLAAGVVQISPFAVTPSLFSATFANLPLFGSTTKQALQSNLERLYSFASTSEQEAFLVERIIALTEKVSGATAVGKFTNLKEIGFDSLMMVSLRNGLEADLGLQVTTSALYSAKNILTLAGLLVAKISPRPITSVSSGVEHSATVSSPPIGVSLADKLSQMEQEDDL